MPESDWRYRTFFAQGLPPGKLLDVGCGDGGFLTMAKTKGFAAAGFDFERRMVELAHSRGLIDVESAEFGEYCRGRTADEFDHITLFDVLEHTPEPGWFLGELKRLLKLGGHVAITLPNALRPLPWGREEHDFPPHHFTRWTPRAMRGFLERNGFRVIRQDAAKLKIYYLAEHFFFYVLMPSLLGAARRLLFGAAAGRTITELYAERSKTSAAPPDAVRGSWRDRARAVLCDKWTRQRVVNAFKALCAVFVYPMAAAMAAYYRLRRPECGDSLFTLARLERK